MMLLHRQQQGRHVAVAPLLVAMCVALSAILLAPAAPLAAAAVSAGATTTSASDAVGEAAAATLGATPASDAVGKAAAATTLGTTPASDAVGGAAGAAAAATPAPAARPTTSPAAGRGGDVFFDTFLELCLNRSDENRNSTCFAVMTAACRARAAGFADPASHARTAACATALPDPDKGGVECLVVNYKKKKGVVLSAKNRKKLVARARKRLARFCEERAKAVNADEDALRGDEAAAFLALDPAFAASPAGVSAGATLAGDDAFLDTFRDLCTKNNRTGENRSNMCEAVIQDACAKLDARADARRRVVTSGKIDLQYLARDVLLGLDPASRTRATACAAALPFITGNEYQCRKASLPAKNEQVSTKKRKKLVAQAPMRLPSLCLKLSNTIQACEYQEVDGGMCLEAFRQGKTSIEVASEKKEKVEVVALLHPGKTFTTTETRTNKHTRDCCGLGDRCLCELKKKLGNNTNSRIPCLEKKELQACK